LECGSVNCNLADDIFHAKLDELLRDEGGARSEPTRIDEQEPEAIEEHRLKELTRAGNFESRRRAILANLRNLRNLWTTILLATGKGALLQDPSPRW
jgi:hypothetical protein